MSIHPDADISTVCDQFNIHPESITAYDIRDGFEEWADFYAFYETLLDGEGGDWALQVLRDARNPKYAIPAALTPLLRRFMTAPGQLVDHVRRERFGESVDETPEAKKVFDSTSIPHLSQALAEVIRLEQPASEYTTMVHAVGPVHTVLTHGRNAIRTVFSSHDITDTLVRLGADRALTAGASPEYLRDIPLEPEVSRDYGMGGYKPRDIAAIEKAGVPAAYAKSLVTCVLGGVGSRAAALIRVWEIGVPAEYLMAANNAMLRNIELIDRVSFDAVLTAYQDGIPVEYLVA